MYEMRSTTSGPETTLTDIIYLGGVVQELEIGVRNGSAETLKVMRSAPSFGVGGSRQDTHIQKPVIGLSDATIGVHDITHVFHDSFLGDTVFENDRVTCMR